MSPLGIATSHLTHVLELGEAQFWLLLVGVNKYQDKGLPSLRYSAVDCQGLAAALADATQGFPQTAERVHHDLSSSLPTLSTVRASLQEITAAAQPQDTILFYFSGHGMLKPNSQQAFLCLADTQTDDLLNTALGLEEILQLLGNSQAQTQLVWLDACHSGSLTFRSARSEISTASLPNPTSEMVELLRQRAKQSKGFYALLSCDTNQQSWEFPELGHGVFTYYLMRGLRGEAADPQGLIDADGLYRYVYHQTRQYIEQTNQQLRLINQQNKSRGDTNLYSEYPQQTPKRIVEGVGEVILGLKPAFVESSSPRQALILEGLANNQTTLAVSKLLRGVGGFELEYWPRSPDTTTQDLHSTIQTCLQTTELAPQNHPRIFATVLLYLRGRLEETEVGEPVLVLAENVRLSRSWLRQQLRRSTYAQQIIILDCPVTNDYAPLQDWVEDLQLGFEQGQCIIAAAAPKNHPEKFAEALHSTLQAAQIQGSLSAAAWITQLQLFCNHEFPLHIWLSGTQGVIEVIPASSGNRGVESTAAIDLGLCPYRGLRAFGEEDAAYFYGREVVVQQLISDLGQKSFIAVVGASGSGKSSVVQAGLIAQLRRGKLLLGSENWWMRSFRPGANPLQALSRRLVDSGTEKEKAYQQLQLEAMLSQGIEEFALWVRHRPETMVVLVIDQFEELFTTASSDDRQRFLAVVLGALEHIPEKFKLIITLRADFIAPCLEVPTLAKLLQQSSLLLPPCLTEEEYRQIIINPAEQVGLTVEAELVEVLVQELHQSPGDLPLLEFVLEQLWEYRENAAITLQAYQQHLGGIKGALESKAQKLYNSLDLEAQECARWIFLSLTQLGEGTEDTRRRVLKSELIVQKYPVPLVERTLQVLIAAKLVVVNLEEDAEAFGESRGLGEQEKTSLGSPPYSPVTVEVAHEVLIRYWSTLRWWLEENRAMLRSHRQIAQAAALWINSDEQPDFLLQGVRLAEAEEIYLHYTDEVSVDVQRFIQACLIERQRQQQKEKNRLRKAQRTVGIMSILGLTAFGLAVLAYQQTQKAQLREIQALNSLSENFLLSHNQLEALLTSLKAGREVQKITPGIPINIQAQTATILQQAVYGTQERHRLTHNSWVSSVSFSPDGQMLASGYADNTIQLWKSDGSLLATLTDHNDGVNSVSFSPDGQILASASSDSTIKLWSREGKLLNTLTGHLHGVNSVSFSPDGRMLASASNDNSARLWSRDGKLLVTFLEHSRSINSVRFSPEGDLIASASDDGTVKLWSLDGRLLSTLPASTQEVLDVSFSPDGQTIASASANGTVKLWSRDGDLLRTIAAHSGGVWQVKFSPDGEIIASASADKTIKLWTRAGNLLGTLQGHSHEVNSLSFSPDSHRLASASDDNTIRFWQIERDLPRTFYGHKDSVNDVRFTADGSNIASMSADNTMKLWNLNGQLLKTLPSPIEDVTSISFSRDGNTVALASANQAIQIRQRDGTLLHTLEGHKHWIRSMSFSPDDQILASGSADKTIKLWNRDGGLWQTLEGHQGWVTNVKFSPDGKILASASADKTIKLWKRDGGLLKTLSGHSASVWGINFSPDGKTIASASQDKTVKLWNLDGSLLHTFQGHSDLVNQVSFSPDGKMIASASDDDTIKVWNISSGILLKSFSGHNGGVKSVSFSPDGKMLVSGGQDATIKLWNLEEIELQTSNLDQLLDNACDRLGNYLQTSPDISREEYELCFGD
ncbi:MULTISPECIES: caspase family protein [unclassified Nodularia (in: cyanobacteria)]|uniref:nSTAND1 domain-containing NTPase n=1 Tax=unclassified Nodularia (in: cyanobacteria) TaxID=2656917 RepID=UPI00187E9FA0|nr:MULTISPECIES: caspase family protein [unclassified Nodularia (in: cyanobacteria)]MBE9200035.1 caspase family protein [Nodularia sp. LEGE 06071]MCC2691938.1 caspase family protein [Nodularia sp. LEGE 04288]